MRTFVFHLFIVIITWITLLEYSHGQREPYPKILTINHSLVNEPFVLKSFRNMRNFIRAPLHRVIPATLWCGAGNISDENEEVGKFFRTDSCCREHDQCDMNIAVGGTLHGLTNDQSFTRSLCACDHKFYDCLKTVKSMKSVKVGTVYFNILGPKCFAEDYPITSCNQTSRVAFRSRCTEYNRNTNAPKEWQWNDNLIF